MAKTGLDKAKQAELEWVGRFLDIVEESRAPVWQKMERFEKAIAKGVQVGGLVPVTLGDPRAIVRASTARVAGAYFSRPPIVRIKGTNPLTSRNAPAVERWKRFDDAASGLQNIYRACIQSAIGLGEGVKRTGWRTEWRLRKKTVVDPFFGIEEEIEEESVWYNGSDHQFVHPLDVWRLETGTVEENGIAVRQRIRWDDLLRLARTQLRDDPASGWNVGEIRRAMSEVGHRPASGWSESRPGPAPTPLGERIEKTGGSKVSGRSELKSEWCEYFEYYGPVPSVKSLGEPLGPYLDFEQKAVLFIDGGSPQTSFLVRSAANPFPHSRPPFVVFYRDQVPGQERGVSILEDTIGLIEKKAVMLSQFIAAGDLAISPPFIRRRGSRAANFRFGPRTVNIVDQIDGEIRQLDVTGIPPQNFDLYQELEREIQRKTDLADISFGLSPSGDKTATEVGAVQSNINVNFSQTISGLKDPIDRDTEMIVRNASVFMFEAKEIPWNRDASVFRRIDRDMLDGQFEFEIAVSSVTQANERKRNSLAQIQALLQQNPVLMNTKAPGMLTAGLIRTYSDDLDNAEEIAEVVEQALGLAEAVGAIGTPALERSVEAQNLDVMERAGNVVPFERPTNAPAGEAPENGTPSRPVEMMGGRS